MSSIVLYESNDYSFLDSKWGFGPLSDVISCTVTEERNGEFTLEMEYPLDGVKAHEIKCKRLIVCKPNPYDDPQAFRIYRINKSIKNRIKIYANHISYDLNGYPVAPFKAGNSQRLFSLLGSQQLISNPFTFSTDKNSSTSYTVEYPSSTRSLLGSAEGTILDVYRGEYKFDNFNVSLLTHRGEDRGVVIAYGKNLTEYSNDDDYSNSWSGLFPYWGSMDGYITTLPEKIIYVSDVIEGYTTAVERISVIDFTEKFENRPTMAQLRKETIDYIKRNKVQEPNNSFDLSFVELGRSNNEQYSISSEEVHLCDTVTIYYPKLDIFTKSKCVETVYDVLKDRYSSIRIGDSRSDLVNEIVDQEQLTEEKATKSDVKNIIEESMENVVIGDTLKIGSVLFAGTSSGFDILPN